MRRTTGRQIAARRIAARRPSLLSRPRNVAETLPCPHPGAPRAVWAIPGYDLACGVARPKAWPRLLFPPFLLLVEDAPVACLRRRRSGGAPGTQRHGRHR